MMNGFVAAGAACVFLVIAIASSPGQVDQYANNNTLTLTLQELARDHPDLCTLSSYGTSRGGRDLWALQLSAASSPDDARALLIVAAIDGTDITGSTVAVEVARHVIAAMAEGQAPWNEVTVHILPRVNPDPMESYFATPQWEQPNALRPWDDDRDGAIDEDGPQDLNGDGLITMMRVRDPEATHLPDKKDARLLKKADRAAGEVPVFKIYSEGLDDDGDEEINEDPFGGVDLNRNFMHGYEEHSPGSGPYQLSEPESLALVDFVLSHPRIAVCMVYGPHDNLINTPSGEKKNETKRAPKGLTKDDVAIYKEIGRIYGKLTEIKSVPKRDSAGAFVAWSYAQFGVPSFATPVWTRPEPEKDKSKDEAKDSGTPSADSEDSSTEEKSKWSADELIRQAAETVTRRYGDDEHRIERAIDLFLASLDAVAEDDLPAADESVAPETEKTEPTDPTSETETETETEIESNEADETPEDDSPESPDDGEGKGKGKKKDKDKDKDVLAELKEDRAWLKYSDDQRDGAGFVEWQPFTHPTLGQVEIGGFVPFFRNTPPVDQLADIIDKQWKFLSELAERLPRIEFGAVEVKALSPTVYEIETHLVNRGYFPYALTIGERNRHVRPLVVTLQLDPERILGGARMTKVSNLAGGDGTHKLRWVVKGKAGEDVRITVASEKIGKIELSVTLTATTK